jgi:hypothetical protein
MVARKASSAFVVVALVGVAASSSAQGVRSESTSSQAREMLLRSMERSRSINASGIVMQRSMPGGELMQLRLEQSASGHVKLTVLSPLSFQGVTSLDDGRQWVTYLPDERRIITQPSPRLTTGDPSWRMRLADRNYTFQVKTGARVAGREAATVIAIPKNRQMPTRQFYIDEATDFLLRLETVSPEGTKVMLDTRTISYPRTMARGIFELNTLQAARVETLPPPVPIPDRRQAQERVGFRPSVPSSLPFGFVAQPAELAGSPSCRFIAVRITDGLAQATVYQWDPKNGEQPLPPDPKADRERNGIRMRVVGELPEAVIVRIIEAFLREAGRGLQAQGQEPSETWKVTGLLISEQGNDRPTPTSGGADASEAGSTVYVVLMVTKA